MQPHDVLFEKNKPHQGNQLLQSLIEFMAADYDLSSRRGQKKQLAISIVLQNQGRWRSIPEAHARWCVRDCV